MGRGGGTFIVGEEAPPRVAWPGDGEKFLTGGEK